MPVPRGDRRQRTDTPASRVADPSGLDGGANYVLAGPSWQSNVERPIPKRLGQARPRVAPCSQYSAIWYRFHRKRELSDAASTAGGL
jgi:hypothetical protein